MRAGKVARLQLIGRIAGFIGVTAAGRQLVEKMEREMIETPTGVRWVLACITNDTDELRRLGAIR